MDEAGGRFQNEIEQLRSICLALPEAVEQETWGDPTFRVRDKIFAMHKSGSGRSEMWCKAPPGAQDILVGAQPDRYFVPPYVGHNGWIGIWLDGEVDWQEVEEHVTESFRMTAPKRLRSAV